MNCCDKPKINNFAISKHSEKHLYCGNCKSHYWRDKFYTREQWERYVHGED